MLLSLTFCVYSIARQDDNVFQKLSPACAGNVRSVQVYESDRELYGVFSADSVRMCSMSWLNNTTVTLVMQNVFDDDPPFVALAIGNNYDTSLATIKGWFWYVQLKKRF